MTRNAFLTNRTGQNRRKFLLRSSAVAALSLLAACGARPGQQPSRLNTIKTAMLLPLTGKHAELGKAMARAVWLVEDTGGATNRMTIIDSGASPETAASASRQAVQNGAELIIGPLFSVQTAPVVIAASPVPVMTLSNDERLAEAGAWTFGVTPAQSVDATLRFARAEGARTLTFLQMPGLVGELTSKALNKGARAARLSILPAVSEPMTKSDLMATLRNIGGGKLPDIFYVPGAGSTARRVAAQAQKAGIQTIGSLQWASLGPQEFSQLDKACFAGPDPARFSRLSTSYRARLEQELGILSALAVDASAFAANLHRKADGKFAMINRTPIEGLLGKCRFRKDRTCERTLAVLRIEDGSVRKVA